MSKLKTIIDTSKESEFKQMIAESFLELYEAIYKLQDRVNKLEGKNE